MTTMLMVKSILSGEFKVTPQKTVSSSAAHCDDDQASATLADETGNSTTAGDDSFVLSIDWNNTSNNDTSFEDPYLESRDTLRRRLCRENQTPSFTESTPHAAIVSPASVRLSPSNSPTKSSVASNFQLSQAVSPMRSLGAFQLDAWPVPTTTPTRDTSRQLDESLDLPITPICRPITPAKRRRHAARERVRALNERLHESSSPVRRGKLHLEIGRAELKARFFAGAVNSFFRAAAVFRQRNLRVALATALDLVTVAFCQAEQQSMSQTIVRQHNPLIMLRCIYEALQIRKEELGHHHVDTVNSLQHLAQLCLVTGHAERAAGYFLEAVNLRKAIFGPTHPSVAVSAHSLGNAYLQAHDMVAAEVWYDCAMHIYNVMNLSNDHSAVEKLLRDRNRLMRLGRWADDDRGLDENLLFEL